MANDEQYTHFDRSTDPQHVAQQDVETARKQLEELQTTSSHETYSNNGPKGQYQLQDTPNDDDPFADPVRPEDQYGPQDTFGDLDNQDPYSNLYDQDPGKTDPSPEGSLYGLAEPLAEPGADNREEVGRDTYGTRISQDQNGYQQ